MTPLRAASLLLASASLGSLIAAAASGFLHAVPFPAAVLALSCAAFRVLGRREAREALARIEALGQPYLDVVAMMSTGVVRRAYVRDEVLAGEEEAAA